MPILPSLAFPLLLHVCWGGLSPPPQGNRGSALYSGWSHQGDGALSLRLGCQPPDAEAL